MARDRAIRREEKFSNMEKFLLNREIQFNFELTQSVKSHSHFEHDLKGVEVAKM